ncbi:MAG TPA: SpoIIE family protein phosphatase [bacterium]|nr:SpoIIE family protein phosphatase [bacterium]
MIKMQLKNPAVLALLLPAGLLAMAVLLDLLILANWLNVMPTVYTREAFVVVGLLLSLPIVYRQRWASDRNVMRGLRSLFLLVGVTFTALLITNLDIFSIQSRMVNEGSLYAKPGAYLYILAWTMLAIVFVLVGMGTLRNLMFIKQQRYTARNFHLLMFFMLLYAVISFRNFENFSARFSFVLNDNAVSGAALFILINLILINSFRVSWLNYLNQKQKLSCFLGGLVLVPLQWLLFVRFHQINPAALFSPVLGKFVDMGMLLLAIYLSVAFVALMALLPSARLFDRKTRQIASLHHLSRALSSEFDFKRLVSVVVNLACEVTEADCGWLELFDGRTEKLRLVSSQPVFSADPTDRDADAEEALTRRLLAQREPLLINDVTKSPYAAELSFWKADLFSLVAVPLTTSEKVLGFLFVCKRLEYGFEQEDASILRAFGEQVVVAIENVRLVESSLEKERLEQELRIAQEAQRKLLPRVMPRSDEFEIYARCLTANEVGGDYYDFFSLARDRIGVVVGDVSGKGASAAFYMAELKGIMEALARNELSPKRVLALANETLYSNLQRDNFITVVYGILDPVQRSFTFCRAGHTPVLLMRQNSDRALVKEPGGIGLALDRSGLFSDTLEESRLTLASGDLLLLYTDGAIEARNEAGEEFGEQRLHEALKRCRQLEARDCIDCLVREIEAHAGSASAFDDLTLVAIKMI